MKLETIKQTWAAFATLTQGVARRVFLQKLRDGQDIKAHRLADVFTPEELREIYDYVRPQKHFCFMNAQRLCELFPSRVKYVEGEVMVCGVPVQHAWNVVDGCTHVDVTFELALNDDPRRDEYCALGVYDINDVRRVELETREYGGVYAYYLKQKLQPL